MTALPSSITSTSAEVRTVTSRSVPVTRSVVPDTSHSSPGERAGRSGAYGPVGSGEDIGEVVSLRSDSHRWRSLLLLLLVFI